LIQKHKTEVLVIGLGNVLLEDEGVGVYAIEELLRGYHLPPAVVVVDGGTSAGDLLEDMASREQIIIADAVNTGAPPGTLVRMVDDEVPALFRTRLSPHQLSLSDTLAALFLMGRAPRHITVIGMVPKSLEMRIGLSDTVKAQFGPMVDLLADELRSLGVDLVPRVAGEDGFWSRVGQ
jgi:hydrogenase maturation protease